MTYCCGWQSDSAAFIIADAAVTRPGFTKQDDRTSFGELEAPIGEAHTNRKSWLENSKRKCAKK